jgi:hypothetical protein
LGCNGPSSGGARTVEWPRGIYWQGPLCSNQQNPSKGILNIARCIVFSMPPALAISDCRGLVVKELAGIAPACLRYPSGLPGRSGRQGGAPHWKNDLDAREDRRTLPARGRQAGACRAIGPSILESYGPTDGRNGGVLCMMSRATRPGRDGGPPGIRWAGCWRGSAARP